MQSQERLEAGVISPRASSFPRGTLSASRYVAVHMTQWSLDLARMQLIKRLWRCPAWSAMVRQEVLRTTTALSEIECDGVKDPFEAAKPSWKQMLKRGGADSFVQCPVQNPHSPQHLASQRPDEAKLPSAAGIIRRAQQQAIFERLEHRPLLVVEETHRVMRVAACCSLGWSLGIRQGMALVQAEALAMSLPTTSATSATSATSTALRTDENDAQLHALRAQQQELLVQLAQRDAALIAVRGRVLALRRSVRMERASLHALALSFERWMPVAAIDGVDAIVGDLRGCAELFRTEHGTEGRFLTSMRDWLATQGVRVHAVMAGTVGAALAVARHGLRGGLSGGFLDGLSPSSPCGSSHSLACDVGKQRGFERAHGRSPLHAQDCAQDLGKDSRQHHSTASVPSGKERDALAPLPLIALRADPAAVAALASVDVHTAGQLAALGRHGVAARFTTRTHARGHESGRAKKRWTAHSVRQISHGASRSTSQADLSARGHAYEIGDVDADGGLQGPIPRKALLHAVRNILDRFDQAIGVRAEVLTPVRFIRRVREEQVFAGPVLLIETVLLAVASLLDRVCATLDHDGLLLRSCALHFDRADIPTLRVDLQLGQPTISRARIWALLRPQLERIQLGYGVLGVTLAVGRVETVRLRNTPQLLDPDATEHGAAPRAPVEVDDVLPASLFMRSDNPRLSIENLAAGGTLAEMEPAPNRLRVGSRVEEDAHTCGFARGEFTREMQLRARGLQLIDTVRARFGDASTQHIRLGDDPAVPWCMRDPLVDPHASSSDEFAAAIVPALRPTVLFSRVEPLSWRQDAERCIRTQLVQSAVCGLPWDGLIEVHWRGSWHSVRQVAGFERLSAPWWENGWRDSSRDTSRDAFREKLRDAATTAELMARRQRDWRRDGPREGRRNGLRGGHGEALPVTHACLSCASSVSPAVCGALEALKVRSWTALRVQLQDGLWDGLWLWALWKDEEACVVRVPCDHSCANGALRDGVSSAHAEAYHEEAYHEDVCYAIGAW